MRRSITSYVVDFGSFAFIYPRIAAISREQRPMNFKLVPYQPPRCRRTQQETETAGCVGSSFEGFIRAGGNLRGVRVGTRAQIAPEEQEEDTPLLREAKKTNSALLDAARRQSRVTMCGITAVLLIITSVFIGLGIVAYRVNDNIAQMEVLLRPHAQSITNATVDMLHDMGGSFTNLKDITKKTKELAHIPTDPIAQSLNNTADITARFREFLKHPTIQLSLGNIDPTGVGGRS